jgi:hypothetical protein
MTERLAGAATAITRAWVRCYTAGLAHDERDDRRAEVESDLHEQRAATTAGQFASGVAMRCVLGMPADLAWRAERADGGIVVAAIQRGLGAGERAAHWVATRGLPALPFILAGFYVLVGSLIILTASGNDQGVAWALRSGAFLLGFGALTWLGWSLLENNGRMGLVLLAGGTILPGLILAVTVVVPIVTVIVLTLGLRRSGVLRRNAAL